MSRGLAARHSQVVAILAGALFSVPTLAQNNDWIIRQQQQQQMMRQQEETRRQQERNRQQALEQQRRLEEDRRRMQDQQRRERDRMLQEQRQRQLADQRRQQDAQRERDLRNRQKDMTRAPGVAPGSNRTVLANGRLARPLTAGEIQRGFTGRVTADGRALVKVQNRVFTVPASRIAGLSARLARLKASTSLSTRQQGNMRELSQRLSSSTSPAIIASRIETARALRQKNQQLIGNAKLVPQDSFAARYAREKPASGTSQALRKGAGVATYDGKLPHVTDPQWFKGRNSVPVPGQIAQRLNGQRFSSFGAFRNALWKEIARDPLLQQSFAADDLKRMRDGKAPKATELQQRGKRQSHELDHHHEIQDGGGTYNVNNIRIKTPDAHARKISRDFNLSSGTH